MNGKDHDRAGVEAMALDRVLKTPSMELDQNRGVWPCDLLDRWIVAGIVT